MSAPHRLHMDKDVLASELVGALDEAIAPNAVEPFDLHRLELAGRISKRLAIGPLARRNGRTRRGLQAGAQIDRQHFLRLKAALQPHRNALDRRALGEASAAVLAKHAEVQQHVAIDIVADQETEPARRIEPFHTARDRRQLRLRGIIAGHHDGPYLFLGQMDGCAYHCLVLSP